MGILMRGTFLIALCLVACSPQSRATSCGDIPMPPQAFDFAPLFPVMIREYPYAQINAACSQIGLKVESGEHYWACARRGVSPEIRMAKVDGFNFSRGDQDCLLHHEWAHLNGWPGDHPGARFT